MKRETGLDRDFSVVHRDDPEVPLPDPVVEKFRIPPQREGYVDRPRLVRHLAGGADTRLTLVSAAAGTGKTTLVSAWARNIRAQRHLAWVSIEVADESRTRFWSSLARGLSPLGVVLPMPPTETGAKEADGDYADEVVSALQGGAVLEPADPLFVVLDCQADLSAVVAHDLDTVLRRSDGLLRLVVVSRVDPPLPLHRYRLAGSLVEIRMADLAFTLDESRELTTHAGLELPDATLRSIVSRTQGWAAGLRFAEVSMTNRDDQECVALGFRGDTGNVADYLMAEVLDAQPEAQRQFLLQTSIIDVLRPGLIEAVAGPQAHSALGLLARGNAYLGELSDCPGWYRYQPLFHDLLRARLDIELPARVPELHRAAAAWMFEHQRLDIAVRHCSAAGDWERAARYVIHDLAIGRLLIPGGDALTVALARLPDDTEGSSASLVRAALAMAAFDADACEEHLLRAEGQLERERAGRLGAAELALQTVRLTHAAAVSDVDGGLGAAVAAERLVGRMPTERVEQHPELVVLIQASKGSAWLMKGDLEAAVDAFSASASAADQPGSEQSLMQCLGSLALLAAIRGRLREAIDLAARVAVLRQQAPSASVGCPSADFALAWVNTELYDLRAARRHLLRAAESAAVAHDPTLRVVSALVDARLRRAHGDVYGALTRIALARSGIPGPLLWLRDVLCIEEVELKVATGQRALAAQTVQGLSLQQSPESALSMARAKSAAADTFEAPATTPWRDAASLPTRISGWLFEATCQLDEGKELRAVQALERSLRLAAPERMRRPFREASPQVRELLRGARQLTAEHSWLGAATLDDAIPHPQSRHGARHDDGPDRAAPRPILETLTEKEREVLGNLAELLTTDEIAGAMFVSVNTVRTHVRNILRKLDASRRNEAVRRARKLGIIPDWTTAEPERTDGAQPA